MSRSPRHDDGSCSTGYLRTPRPVGTGASPIRAGTWSRNFGRPAPRGGAIRARAPSSHAHNDFGKQFLTRVDEIVFSLATKGLADGGFQANLAEVHGAEASRKTISTITDMPLATLARVRARRHLQLSLDVPFAPLASTALSG